MHPYNKSEFFHKELIFQRKKTRRSGPGRGIVDVADTFQFSEGLAKADAFRESQVQKADRVVLAEFDDRGRVPASSYAMFRQPGVLEQIRTRLGVQPKEMIGYVQWNIKAVHDAGIPVITGTDSGVPVYCWAYRA